MNPEAEISLRDELLELLYWIEGERLAGAGTFAEITRILTCAPAELTPVLEALIDGGLLRLDEASREYRLTEPGRREAARRFAEEFGPLLGQGHGECNDPDCECHADPASAAECHERRRAAGRGA